MQNPSTNFAHMTDHDLFRHISKRIRLGWNWEPIADELGMPVKEVVEWVNEYKWPPKKPMVHTGQPVKGSVRDLPKTSPKRMTAQFLAWKRQHDGARKTLEIAG